MYALHKPRPRPARLRFRFTRWPSRAPTTTHTHTESCVWKSVKRGRSERFCICDRFARARTVCIQACVYAHYSSYTPTPLLPVLLTAKRVDSRARSMGNRALTYRYTQRGVTLRGCS